MRALLRAHAVASKAALQARQPIATIDAARAAGVAFIVERSPRGART